MGNAMGCASARPSSNSQRDVPRNVAKAKVPRGIRHAGAGAPQRRGALLLLLLLLLLGV